ncbi:MAG TPA: hypothetical protein VK727_03900 [Steroidobacteraceae bacterium]|nr:hypothetical protein [Steroidobacteraceae bacterium]
MYLEIGYSNEPSASRLVASQGGKPKDLVRVPPSPYVDAVFVEVVAPTATASYRPDVYLTRAQAAIRLYTSIFNYRERPSAGLFVSA